MLEHSTVKIAVDFTDIIFASSLPIEQWDAIESQINESPALKGYSQICFDHKCWVEFVVDSSDVMQLSCIEISTRDIIKSIIHKLEQLNYAKRNG